MAENKWVITPLTTTIGGPPCRKKGGPNFLLRQLLQKGRYRAPSVARASIHPPRWEWHAPRRIWPTVPTPCSQSPNNVRGA